MIDHTCTEKIDGDFIYFYSHPSRAKNRYFIHVIQFKTIPLDNASEFTSQNFNDYCISIGIIVEHLVAHVHTQNSLVEF